MNRASYSEQSHQHSGRPPVVNPQLGSFSSLNLACLGSYLSCLGWPCSELYVITSMLEEILYVKYLDLSLISLFLFDVVICDRLCRIKETKYNEYLTHREYL